MLSIDICMRARCHESINGPSMSFIIGNYSEEQCSHRIADAVESLLRKREILYSDVHITFKICNKVFRMQSPEPETPTPTITLVIYTLLQFTAIKCDRRRSLST